MLRLRGAWASRAGFHTGNALVLHQGGDALFKRMVEAIDQARREILFETYIFCHDRIGQSVSAALCRAAERGVTVRVITDGLGTARLDLFKQWPAAGVDHRIYNPHVFGRQGFARTHRKLAAVDREIAFVGGINVVDDFRNGDHELPFPRWDFAIEVAGPVVAEVVQSIDKQWRRLDPAPPGERAPRPPRTVTHVATSLPASPEPCVAFVSRDNFRNRRAIENAYLVAIGRARHQILLANPYFVPGRRLRRALVIAAQRGVDVRLLVGCKEFVLLDWAVPWLYGKLLNAGVRIAEYDKTLLHGKVAVIDDWWGTVGSSNLDAFSLLVNQEANLVIVNDPALVELKRAMLAALDDATAIDGSHYTARAWWRRLGNWFAYRLYRVAMKLLTIGRYD
ncbi:cardiolipin synthase ClsB [Chitinasiproducens palmae]|nr:cardiolipin synthase ClsB [Chitinasiproducens palmae]